MKKNHAALYFFEFAVIGGGFATLLVFSFTFYQQLGILGLILFFYLAIGLYHHSKHRDINLKVVLEYILVSALIVALFVFLNLNRI